MGVKKRGDFFSKTRSLKEFYYPKFFIKKNFYRPFFKGKKNFRINQLLSYNKELVYTNKSCRRLDLLFAVFVYSSLFKFRSTNLVFIKRRLNKIMKKKVYGNVSYNQLEKNSTKLFFSIFKKTIIEKKLAFFFLIQKYSRRRLIKNYRKRSYSLLMSVSSNKK